MWRPCMTRTEILLTYSHRTRQPARLTSSIYEPSGGVLYTHSSLARKCKINSHSLALQCKPSDE